MGTGKFMPVSGVRRLEAQRRGCLATGALLPPSQRGEARERSSAPLSQRGEARERADWFAKWQHVINEAPTDEGADQTAAALQLQVTVQGRTRMIDAYPTTTAVQLERMVVERVGIDGFALYYRGRPLHSTTALSNYGITNGATIELKERGRGGGCSQSKSSTVHIEELIPAVVEAGSTPRITPATIEPPESVATELSAPHAAALEPASYRERHDARARELGVSEEALRSIGAPRVRAREGAALRVLQWNVLAEGLSDDGFLVRDVLDGAADGAIDQAAAERAKRNHAAVVDWTRRWARMLEFIAASKPDVIALEELDHMADAQEELRALGYECAVHGKQYRPVHEWADASARDPARYLQHLRDVGVALAPKTRSNCRKLGRRTREDADDDGVALFWRSDDFALLSLDFLAFDDAKRDQGAVRASLRRNSDGLAFAVIAAHLSSGVENEAARLEELTRLLGWCESGTPTVWCADTNSAPDHEGERTVWKALRRVTSSVWDDFFDKEGRVLQQPSPVTTNKMRGPLSAQKKKIGEHTYGAVDDIFFGPGVSMRQHAWGPLTYESQEEARTHLLPSLDIPSDHAPVLVDLHLLRDGWQRRLSLPKVVQGKLAPYNFESLWAEKRASHLQGTREWAFEEIEQWRKDESASKLFWLMGGGGVGKSVLSAELLARWLDKRCVAAWHFCRHDDTDQSKPANLLRSIAAMLCHTLDGFEEALNGATGLENALVSADPSVVFDVLIHKPLEKVPSQTAARVIMVDALDEIPKEGQKPLLDVIVNQLASLPTWLRVFVTSREEPLIQKALSAFRPKELRADEAKNRADVEVFLRTIAREHVKGQANMSDVAKAVERQFKIKLPSEALSSLQEKMDESRAIYELAVRKLKSDPKLRELEQVNEMREPKPKQQSSEFETIYDWAERAQEVLEQSVASEWEEDHALKWLKHPKSEAKKSWVSQADSPGVKGKERAAEKCQNDYDGDAAHLKDVARLTLLFDSFEQMIDGLEALRNKCGFKVVALKNKFAHPTPMGYRDLNLCVEVPIDTETRFVCEVQINHSVMIEAKAKAHKPYEHIRSELPKLCKGTGVDADKLEAFIVGQLNSSALDVAVSALSAKAQGLFLYAFMLQQYLDSEARASRTIRFDNLDTLPAGLDDVYAVNFRRAFPTDAPERWATAKPLLELLAATMEPISVAMAASLLRWTADEQERVLELTALLFPVRDGLIHVFHKTVVDWITGDVSEGSSIKTGASEFRVQRDEGHRRFAEGFTRWLQGDANEPYWLKHGIVHLCRAGRADDAVRVYSSDLSFLRRRLDAGELGTVSTDYIELRRYSPVDLKHATQMKSFVGKHRDVFERERGRAVTQLASQQPDESVVFRALGQQEQYLKWRNKPQTFDPCIAMLSLSFNQITSLAVTKSRIVVGAGRSVYVYDATTEELLEELGCGEVCSVAIYEEQEAGSIVAGLADRTIKVWDSATLELKSEKSNAHSGPISSLGFSPDGRTIVSGSDDTRIIIWDAATLELKSEAIDSDSGRIASVAFSPDGKTVVSCAIVTIKVWDSATLELKSEKCKAHDNSINSAAFSPDGKTIISGSDDRAIKVWDLRPVVDSEWEEVDISARKNGREKVCIDGLGLVSSNFWRNTITGGVEKQKPTGASLELKAEKSNAHRDEIRCVTFSPDGKTIVSGCCNKKIKVWDFAHSRPFDSSEWAEIYGKWPAEEEYGKIKHFYNTITGDIRKEQSNAATLQLKAEKQNAHMDGICCLAFFPDGETIVSGSLDSTIKIWDSASLELKVEDTIAHRDDINSVAFSPDGKTIVSGSDDKSIKVWDSATLELKSEKRKAHYYRVTLVAFSPDCKAIVSGSGDTDIKLWDAGSLELKAEEQHAHTSGFFTSCASVQFSPDGTNIVSAGTEDRTIKIWDAGATLKLKSEKRNAHTSSIRSLAVSPAGKIIVSGSINGTIKIWDSGGTLELMLEKSSAHGAPISAVAFSPDGNTICTSGDRTIKVWFFLQPIWDAAALELKSEAIDAHSDAINSVVFLPDGKTIVSGSNDKSLKIWDTGTLQLIEERPGCATTVDKCGQVVDHNGSTLRFKGDAGAFYAPSSIVNVAVHEKKIVAGASSGELYHLEVM